MTVNIINLWSISFLFYASVDFLYTEVLVTAAMTLEKKVKYILIDDARQLWDARSDVMCIQVYNVIRWLIFSPNIFQFAVIRIRTVPLPKGNMTCYVNRTKPVERKEWRCRRFHRSTFKRFIPTLLSEPIVGTV